MEEDQATSGKPNDDQSVVSMRTMEVIVGAILVFVGSAVVWDSIRLGHTWGPSGPGAGYFPFYIGLFIIFAGATVAILNILGKGASSTVPFVTRGKLKSVLAVFIPTTLYVLGLEFVGLYISCALFIIGFMMFNGKYALVKTLPYAIVVPVLLFFMFEKWFLISLPKSMFTALPF